MTDLKTAQKFTQPPARYTEATLIKIMEEKGIGRPSTYAPTISVIQDRGYVDKDKKTLLPSELGMMVNEKLEHYFQTIVDAGFTADMETSLDEIIEGKHTWNEVVTSFYEPFETLLTKANAEMEKVNTDKPSDEVCEKCGSPMVIKTGRFGEFLACSNFPTCKSTKPITMSVKCPKCDHPLVQRKTKKGKVFYGCSHYPECKFAAWDKPIQQTCETCGSKVMFVKASRQGKETIYCANCTAPAPKTEEQE